MTRRRLRCGAGRGWHRLCAPPTCAPAPARHPLQTPRPLLSLPPPRPAPAQNVITELDDQKNKALRSTWEKVNGHFGAVFKSLLPGVSAKLAPPEGGTVLDGLEVKVAFNGVWKETLTDLSGGQRSLLALSLILAMLLFKPAPMYILDEIDAALDLSHTQNIGAMIRSHFAKSQFIVVSLKQGLFSNANVIFRTKFVEVSVCAGGGCGCVWRSARGASGGAPRPRPPPPPALPFLPAPQGIGSTVTRTVPAGSSLLEVEDAPVAKAAGKAAGAGKRKVLDAETEA